MLDITITVPFTAGRADASQEQTDIESFAALEPAADGFRNYVKPHHKASAENLLVDKAQLMKLTAPEMTAIDRWLKGYQYQLRPVAAGSVYQ